MTLLLALLLALAPQATAPTQPAPVVQGDPVAVLSVTVLSRHPHDRAAFTQGLVWHDGALFESVGREGTSEVRRVDFATGRVLRRAAIPATQFGEGLAVLLTT